MDANKIYTVEYVGNGLTEGTLQIIDGRVRHTNYIKMDKWYVKNNSGGLSLVDKYKTNTLVAGSTFNSRIKSLGEIIEIEFLYSGEIPQGHTKEEFYEKGIDLSSKNDKSILALYEEGKVYI